jgi:ribosomal protein S16
VQVREDGSLELTPAQVTLDKEKIKAWYTKGARPTKTVENLFQGESVLKELAQ